MINMKTTTNCFSVSRLTDSDLHNLLFAVEEEFSKRRRKREEERQKWIDGYYYAFINHPNATAIQVGDTTVVAAYARNTGMHIGTAKPVHGDVFNREVGLAVAYAKAFDTVIPDYI
jgi:hypothetical protein